MCRQQQCLVKSNTNSVDYVHVHNTTMSYCTAPGMTHQLRRETRGERSVAAFQRVTAAPYPSQWVVEAVTVFPVLSVTKTVGSLRQRNFGEANICVIVSMSQN